MKDRTSTLNENEQLILLEIARLGEAGYGMTIRREIEVQGGRTVSIATVYTVLDRLESKRLVVSQVSEPLAIRGGRSRRYYTLTPTGAEALVKSRRVMNRMWDQLELNPRGGSV